MSRSIRYLATSVRNLPELKTAVGRGRAWLYLALMQKKLADYLKVLVDNKNLLSEFYEPEALMMEEEGTVLLAMLLVGLNVLDANLCLKGERRGFSGWSDRFFSLH